MPLIHQDTIRFVLRKLTLRGPTWARECMDRVEGFDRWPQQVQAAVQAAEREALEYAAFMYQQCILPCIRAV